MPAAFNESTAPDIASQAPISERIVLPLEGKGDRSAVDEVKMRTPPLSRSVRGDV